jgi:hypothetical protein
MFSLSRRKILKNALRLAHCDSHGIKWWLKDESIIPVAKSTIAVVDDIANNNISSDIEIFKLHKRKTVFRLKNPNGTDRLFVAKVFFLNHFSHRLSCHLYGLDEAANLVRARTKGINTPEVYGYGDIRDTLGFVKTSIIILEDLHNLFPIGELMNTMTEAECTKIFMSTIPLFINLYQANCNHIDISSSAIMFSNHNANPTLSLLDFQHAKFYDKPSTEVLMFESGYFARSCRNWVLPETIYQWLDKIFSHIGVNDPVERAKMRDRFDYYFLSKGLTATQSTLSRKQRKSII